jgi:hypothetical protein
MFARCVGFLEDTVIRDCWKSGVQNLSISPADRVLARIAMKLPEQAEQQASEEIGATLRTDYKQARVVPDERWVVPRCHEMIGC